VVSFVYRADVPKEPETVTTRFLEEQVTLRTTLAALDTDLRKLSDSVVATRRETQTSIATAREEVQKALDALAEDLTAARKFMLQIAQLGWLNHEMNVENANGIRKAAAASQEVSKNSAELAETMRRLSDSLASQLTELATRLDAIQNRISNVK
jgi:chromosome segregation ATPase